MSYEPTAYSPQDSGAEYCRECIVDMGLDPDGDDMGACFADSEVDSPSHCDSCGAFLPHSLTRDGEEYVREALSEGEGDPDVLAEWREYYSYLVEAA